MQKVKTVFHFRGCFSVCLSPFQWVLPLSRQSKEDH